MRHTIITALFSVLLLRCGTTGHRCYGQDSTLTDQDSLTYSRMKTPGEIRYAVEKDWTQDDWKDNEYYRCIRSTIDAYLESGLDQPGTAAEEFAPYRDILPGKFAICYAEHFMYGGLYISFASTSRAKSSPHGSTATPTPKPRPSPATRCAAWMSRTTPRSKIKRNSATSSARATPSSSDIINFKRSNYERTYT